MAGTIIVDRIESDASYASTINVANKITFSNTANFVGDGNIGIGTSSPGCKLEVNGLVRATSLTNPTSGSGIEVGYDGTQGVIQAFSNRVTNTSVPINIQGDLKMNSGYGSSAVAYGCRAWVNFNGSGGASIRGSGNIASVVRTSGGIYYVTFTNNMPDTNFCFVGSASVSDGNFGLVSGDEISTRTVNKTGTFYTVNTASVNNAADANNINIAIFR
jgi:hypothetical protein